jgi:CBS domain containing-hemolysin-like protein
MPDTDAPPGNERPASSERSNLPVPVPRPSEVAREGGGETWLGRMLRTLFGWKAGSIRQDLEVVLEAGAPTDTGFSPQERTMLKNILGLRERRVEDVMIPRADIISVQQGISLGELIKVFESAGHSRLVVYNDTLDDPVGMVHIRDVIAYMAARAAVAPEANAKRKKPFPANLDLKAVDLGRPLSDTQITREILFVPPSMPVIDLFAKMQAIRIHLALVIDEYGGTDGLVSIEDIVEQVVGEIDDEHDEEAPITVVRQRDGSFLADARTNLEDVVTTLGAEFDVGDAAEEVDTLGGYLVTKVGRVPVRGELVPGPGDFEIEVVDADPRRVKKVRIYRRGKRAPAPGALPRRIPKPGETAPAADALAETQATTGKDTASSASKAPPIASAPPDRSAP